MRFRRHMRPGIAPEPQSAEEQPVRARRRSPWRDAGLVLLVAVVGFVVAMVWFSPVPIFSRENAVPMLVGTGLTDAQQELAGLGYSARVEPAIESPIVPRGQVVRQDPPAGTSAPRNTVIHLTPSAGQMPVLVPDLVGLEMGQAEQVLAAAGLKTGSVDSVIDREQDGGVVLATRPSAGAGRTPGSTVDLIVNGANQ